ncbi:MAG: hypothetical protein AAGC71_12750 [Pseudomonadota bacterium]
MNDRIATTIHLRLVLVCCGLLGVDSARADDTGLDAVVRLAVGAIELSRHHVTDIWPGLSNLGPGFVLVSDDYETAFCFQAAPGFEPLDTAGTLDCATHRRVRVLPRQLQASLNLFSSEETVVTAGPSTLGQSDTDWQLLFIHERFHQWQSTLPGYAASIAKLDLAGDDQTGMWMLNYPFPYADPAVNTAFDPVFAQLAQLFVANELHAADLDHYRQLRKRAFATVTDPAQRYAEFQLWKEGAARWTELAAAEALALIPELDADRFSVAALDRRTTIVRILTEHSLATAGRGMFYAFGAAEWQLVQRIDPSWRERYGRDIRLKMDRVLTEPAQ